MRNMGRTSAKSNAIDYKSMAQSKDCKEGEKVLIGRVESIAEEERLRGKKVVRSITFEFLYPTRDHKITGVATLTEENRSRFNIKAGDEVYLFASKAEKVGYFIECGNKISADEATSMLDDMFDE